MAGAPHCQPIVCSILSDGTCWRRWLLSDENNVIRPIERSVNQDMTKPLSLYFINSSHNSYLDGHQWTSNASADMYRRHLLMGCRCVEIDCWDGKDHEPQVRGCTQAM